MELKTLSNCIISGIETACFKLCKTCSETSHCGNPNACTSCYPGDNKVSENIDDKFFQCSKECDVIQIRLDDGSYFCPSPTESSTLKFLTETTEANSLVSKSSKHVESNTTWTIFIAIVFLGVIIIIALWISRKNALKKTISNNHFQEICVTNKKSFISPSSNISKSLIKPSFTKQVAPEKTKTSLEVIMNNKDFEKGKKLRGGNYSTVFEGTLRGEIVAIKVARKEGKKNIYKELQVYEKVEHPSIIKALGVHFSVENMLFLKKRNFNLSDYFIDYGNELNFLRLKQYCIQIADGMRYLHEKQILHGDLKIDNILVKDEDGEFVEISDFGSAIDLKHDQELKYCGTVTHTAYEILKKMITLYYPAIPSKASDVWSFAITAWQIFQKTFKLPTDFLLPKDIVANYEQGKRLPTPALVTETFWRYIFYQCFDLDPESRPTMAYLHKILINFREDSPCSSTFTV